MPNDSVSAADQAVPNGPLTPEEEARLSLLEKEYIGLLRRWSPAAAPTDSERRQRLVFERFTWDRLGDLTDRISGELEPRLQLINLACWCEAEISDVARDALLRATEDVGEFLDELTSSLEELQRTARRRVEAEFGKWVPLRDGEVVDATGEIKE